jgi:hypothetical protein
VTNGRFLASTILCWSSAFGRVEQLVDGRTVVYWFVSTYSSECFNQLLEVVAVRRSKHVRQARVYADSQCDAPAIHATSEGIALTHGAT